MKLQRDEIMTGVLAIFACSVLVSVLLVLAPGFLGSRKTYYIYFDNASGIEAGTEVFLAGRRIGQVVDLESPVPANKRPPDRPEMETMVEVKVAKDARIYRAVSVRMLQYGWFGQQMIDFIGGEEPSGLAPSGTTFVGERTPGLNELSDKADATLQGFTATLGNLEELTRKGGDLSQTAANAREFTDTIKKQPWRLIWRSKKPVPAHADGETSGSRGSR